MYVHMYTYTKIIDFYEFQCQVVNFDHVAQSFREVLLL